jgi:hypothetical protein
LDLDRHIAKFAKLLKQEARINNSNPRYLLQKSLQDIEDLERFYKDKEYRKALESAMYLSSEYLIRKHRRTRREA